MIAQAAVVRFLLCALGLALGATAASAQQAPWQAAACSLQGNESLHGRQTAGLHKLEIRFRGVPTESGEATILRDGGRLAIIRSRFFGETGQSEINYFFAPSGPERYLVELTEHHYSRPLSQKGAKTASITTARFVVCPGQTPSYPDAPDLRKAHDRAVVTLKFILKAEKSAKTARPDGKR